MKTIFTYIILLLLLCQTSVGQEALPLAKEIAAFRTADSLQFPADRQILFVGSSSFTLWKKVNEDFPGYGILNRAFGGSTLLDLIRYRYEVIYPHRPRQIVIYCGENDFAAHDSVTVDDVVQRFQTLFRLIRQRHPKVPLVYVSMKPSPSRAHLMEKYKEANERIRSYLAQQPKAAFADVYTAMLNADGKPREEIFGPDRLHMNEQGYLLWQQLLKPFLKR